MNKILDNLKIVMLGSNTVFLSNENINFSYTPADDICKPEYKGQYRYFGGLQCELKEGTDEFKILEDKLCKICEAILKG